MRLATVCFVYIVFSFVCPPAVRAETRAVEADSGPLGFGAAALERDMETDRPDFTEGTQTIEAGHLQLESGYTFVYDDASDGRSEIHALPEALLRVGLLEDLELRIGWEGYLNEEVTTKNDSFAQDTADGFSDMSVGFKHMMYEQGDYLPNLSFIAELGLPVGSSEFTSDDVEGAFVLTVARDLSESLSFGSNLGFASVEGEDERYLEVSASATLGLALTDTISSYLEYFGIYPTDSVVEDNENYISSGLTYALTGNLQLDARIGAGLNSSAADFFTGAGLSLRL